jgi:hypothetical protein
MWIFHTGAWLSAYSFRMDLYCQLDSNCGVVTRHESIDDWYVEFIRPEYARRYGI